MKKGGNKGVITEWDTWEKEMTEEILINISPSPKKKLRGKKKAERRKGKEEASGCSGMEERPWQTQQEVHSQRHSPELPAWERRYPKEGQHVKWSEISEVDLLLNCTSTDMPYFKKIWYLRTHIEKTGLSVGDGSPAFVKCFFSLDKRSCNKVLQ